MTGCFFVSFLCRTHVKYHSDLNCLILDFFHIPASPTTLSEQLRWDDFFIEATLCHAIFFK